MGEIFVVPKYGWVMVISFVSQDFEAFQMRPPWLNLLNLNDDWGQRPRVGYQWKINIKIGYIHISV